MLKKPTRTNSNGGTETLTSKSDGSMGKVKMHTCPMCGGKGKVQSPNG